MISDRSTRLYAELLPPEDQACVLAELERVLESVPFRSSRRYPALLRYVVEKTLNGEVDDLKERTLGIEVFHRPSGYDTSADPVVRFSAGEVRRRIAQFYRENPPSNFVELRLPVGAYIPEFVWRGRPADSETLPEFSSTYISPTITTAAPADSVQEPAAIAPAAIRKNVRMLWVFLAGALTTLLMVTAAQVWKAHEYARSPLLAVWQPLLSNSNRVVLTVGRTHVDSGDTVEPSSSTVEQHILRPAARISLPAVEAVSQLAGFLEAQRKPFRLHEALATQLQELHASPAVMVTGYNNAWTLRLLRPLRFRLAELGEKRYIEDTMHPANTGWDVHFDRPYLEQTADYAIVARYNDATTGGPVMIVAGISSNGTRAAGEFMVSPSALEELARRAPQNSLAGNFEAVLKIEVVAGEFGATSIVAAQFW